MSTEPLPPVQPPAVPPAPPAGAAPTAPGPAPRRRVPSRGWLVAALVVAVVLLLGSVGATAAFVHSHVTADVTRVVGPNGRMFVFPGPGDGRTYQLPKNPGREYPGMPMAPWRHGGAGQKQPTPTPSPAAS